MAGMEGGGGGGGWWRVLESHTVCIVSLKESDSGPENEVME